MTAKEELISLAKNAILSQAASIEKMASFINDDYVKVLEVILQSKGRIIFTGIGKSAIIAQKIVATFNSTGTPAVFLHASEAIHGDLGMVLKDDVVICISKSGNSPEIKILVPIIKNFGNILVAITGNLSSFLAKSAALILNTTIDSESCPHNLAPTNSTTAQLVMGDALAICLMNMRNFKPEDFAKYHPGGALGKKLLLRVQGMISQSLRPNVTESSTIKEVIFEISEKRLGVTAVLDGDKLQGIITDGDIRRMLNKYDNFSHLVAKDIMTKNPKTVDKTSMVIDALNVLEDNAITQLVVLDGDYYAGILHLHDILKEGIV